MWRDTNDYVKNCADVETFNDVEFVFTICSLWLKFLSKIESCISPVHVYICYNTHIDYMYVPYTCHLQSELWKYCNIWCIMQRLDGVSAHCMYIWWLVNVIQTKKLEAATRKPLLHVHSSVIVNVSVDLATCECPVPRFIQLVATRIQCFICADVWGLGHCGNIMFENKDTCITTHRLQ